MGILQGITGKKNPDYVHYSWSPFRKLLPKKKNCKNKLIFNQLPLLLEYRAWSEGTQCSNFPKAEQFS